MSFHFAILTHLPESPSLPIMEAAAKKLNCRYELLDTNQPDHCREALARTTNRPQVIMTRIGSSANDGALEILRDFEAAGIPCCNSTNSILLARDKWQTQQVLEAAAVQVPKGLLLAVPKDLENLENHLGPAPWILKEPVSCKGIGVMLATSLDVAEALAKQAWKNDSPLVAQRFVAESKARDTRVLVVGGAAVAAVERVGAEGEFRSNLYLGGSAKHTPVAGEKAELAIAASQAMGLHIAGIDILDSNDGPVVIEANASPGLHGTQSVNERDLGQSIIESLIPFA